MSTPRGVAPTVHGGCSHEPSFLVGPDGAAHLIGIGRQNNGIANGAFVYQGGILPASPAAFDAVVIMALAAVPGLKGFVGVDYLRDDAANRVSVLEVNPRPTTWYGDGLARSGPVGRGLARPGPGS